MTAADGSWVWDVIYAPFGGVSYIWSNPANIDLRFPGQWFQLESGLAAVCIAATVSYWL